MVLRMISVLAGFGLFLGLAAQSQPAAPLRYVTMGSPPQIMVSDTSPSGMKGLYADILDDILTRRMGLAWTGTLLPWKRAQLEVQAGTADLMITIPTEERRAYALASLHPVVEEYLHVYTYADHPKIKEIRGIKSAEDILRLGLVPVTNLGNGWHRQNIDAFGVKTHYAPADQNIALFLASKRADIMIDLPMTMNPMIKSLGLANRIEMTPARFGPISFHILVSRKSPFAASMNALDQATEQFIRDGTQDRLISKYLAP